MDIHNIVMYVLFGLLSIVGYFIKGKLEAIDSAMLEVSRRLDKHQDEDTAMHMKMLEFYVTKNEYSQTIGRIFDMLTNIADDIKGLLTTKVDK